MALLSPRYVGLHPQTAHWRPLTNDEGRARKRRTSETRGTTIPAAEREERLLLAQSFLTERGAYGGRGRAAGGGGPQFGSWIWMQGGWFCTHSQAATVAFQGCNPIYGPQYATLSSKYPFCYNALAILISSIPGGAECHNCEHPQLPRSLDSWFLDKAHDSAAPCRRTDKTMAE